MRAAADAEVARFAEAAARGDAPETGATVGEAIGLIHGIEPAGEILRAMVHEAEAILGNGSSWITT